MELIIEGLYFVRSTLPPGLRSRTLSLPNPGPPPSSNLLPPTFQRKVSASIFWGIAGTAGEREYGMIGSTIPGPACGPCLGKGTGRSARRSGWLGGWRLFLVVLWRPVPTIHTCDRLDWLSRSGLGSCDSTCIAHRSSSCRLCGTWTVHDCTTESRSTRRRGAHAGNQRDRGASSESCLSGPGQLTLTAFFFSFLLRTRLRSRFSTSTTLEVPRRTSQ